MKFEYIPTDKVPTVTQAPTLVKFLSECSNKDSVRIPLNDLKNGRRSVTGVLAVVAKFTGRRFTMTNDKENLFITPKNGIGTPTGRTTRRASTTPTGNTLRITHPLRGHFRKHIAAEVRKHGTVIIPKRSFRTMFSRGHFVVRMRRDGFKVVGTNRGSKRITVTVRNAK